MIEQIPNSSRPAQRGGFSLVELLAVLAISAVLLTAAIPALGTLRSARIEAAQSLIARDLSYARDRAIATGTPHRVTFDINGQLYRIQLVPSGDPASSVVTPHTTPGGGEFVVRLGQGDFPGVQIQSVGIGGNGASVTFDWRGVPHRASGTPLGSGTHQVRLVGGRGVRIHAGTGLAERFSF